MRPVCVQKKRAELMPRKRWCIMRFETMNTNGRTHMATIQPPVEVLDDRHYFMNESVPAETRVTITYNGRDYAWDLTKKNAEKLDEHLKVWLGFAQEVKGVTRRRSSGVKTESADRERNQTIRDWARGQGMKVSDRGRLSNEIIFAYDQAH
jgi:hypothetical protein